ncbi:lipocalin family protein [Pseudomonas sp. RIT-PI-AD]|uniref:lipocalin family protein n=1 Tax=Pseudomonas sp. RIT-PI-AD TaxID=3035294 RepID=UPI0021D8732C|nr:lipocalin family protein [Pseudomonas sp. RIT-PI-AD]
MRALVAVLAASLLLGCAGPSRELPPPKTVAAVDLQRYQGTWYELARLPMFFQRNCAQSEAHYRLLDAGRIEVENRCRTREGDWNQVHGQAFPQVAGQTDKLWVRFDNWFSSLYPDLAKGQYWVLYLDDDYQTAVVGHPDRDYLWLLARQPEVDGATRERLLEVARSQGYDTSALIWRAPDSAIHKF